MYVCIIHVLLNSPCIICHCLTCTQNNTLPQCSALCFNTWLFSAWMPHKVYRRLMHQCSDSVIWSYIRIKMVKHLKSKHIDRPSVLRMKDFAFNGDHKTVIYVNIFPSLWINISRILILFMSAFLCMCVCVSVSVYNYSDTQGDSPKSRKIVRDKKASKEKRQLDGGTDWWRDLREGKINIDLDMVFKIGRKHVISQNLKSLWNSTVGWEKDWFGHKWENYHPLSRLTFMYM